MNAEELRAAHAIVAEGRAYTREHFSRPSSGYVGHTPAAQYDTAVDTLVAGLGAVLDEAERLRDVARRACDLGHGCGIECALGDHEHTAFAKLRAEIDQPAETAA